MIDLPRVDSDKTGKKPSRIGCCIGVAVGSGLLFMMVMGTLILFGLQWNSSNPASRIQSPKPYRTPTQAGACRKNLDILSHALESYARDHQGQYPDKLTDLMPKYLATLPSCPLVGETFYKSTYSVDKSKTNYSLHCNANHPDYGPFHLQSKNTVTWGALPTAVPKTSPGKPSKGSAP